ncbi:MAG: beta-ketoacyl synthase [Desulfuromonas sp.]|nr:MAG: beta-ketoacyl synthase [Desulfuromonas sp.]
MLKGELLGIGWLTAAGTGRGRDAAEFALVPGELSELRRQLAFTEPDRRFGRLDRFSRLGVLAMALALQDAGLDRWEQKRRVGLFAATRFGSLGTDSDYFATVLPEQGRLASPNLFAYTLANTFLGEAAIRFGLTGPGVAINEGGNAPLESLVAALEGLVWDGLEASVAGFCDLPPRGSNEPPGAAFLVVGPDRPGKNMKEIKVLPDRSVELAGVPVSGWPELVAAAVRLQRT